MSKFSINDKVSFINEKQDGIIRDIRPSGICVVEIEDGFTIDAMENELVLIKQTIPVAKKPEEVKKDEPSITIEFIKNLSLPKEGIWLIGCPAVSGMVSTGPADFYVVNTTSYDVLTACSLKKNNVVTGIISDILHPSQHLLITRIKREEAFDKGDLLMQLLFHNKGNFEQQPSVQKEFSFQFPDISHGRSQLPAPYAFCTVQQVASLEPMNDDQLELLQKKYSGKDLQEALSAQKKAVKKIADVSSTKNNSLYEVDLHIEELTNDISGMSNSEMLDIQLRHFRKKLDEALLSKPWKLVFIHGNGNGRLKSSIRKELTEHGIRFTDGSFERYGGGATEVLF